MGGGADHDDEGRGNHEYEKSLDSTHDSVVLIISTRPCVVGFSVLATIASS
jgi:hypothetical protein